MGNRVGRTIRKADLRDDEGRPVWGLADKETRTIWVKAQAKGFSELYLKLHEHRHVWRPSWKEKRVRIDSREVARFLWAQGYRLVRQRNKSSGAPCSPKPAGRPSRPCRKAGTP